MPRAFQLECLILCDYKCHQVVELVTKDLFTTLGLAFYIVYFRLGYDYVSVRQMS